jgi:hypothetical protein
LNNSHCENLKSYITAYYAWCTTQPPQDSLKINQECQLLDCKIAYQNVKAVNAVMSMKSLSCLKYSGQKTDLEIYTTKFKNLALQNSCHENINPLCGHLNGLLCT